MAPHRARHPAWQAVFRRNLLSAGAARGYAVAAQVLGAAHEAWTERRDQVEDTASAVLAALAEARSAHAANSDAPSRTQLSDAAEILASREDRQYGGFGGADPTAPKFPVATALRFLQSSAVRMANPAASAVADRALRAMASAPLRDHIEGGFFRYATRRDWSVPHYERMLTDNAQLLEVATDAGDGETARGIAGFLLNVLQQPSGGFGAAQDSESWIDDVRSEGGYYERDAAARAELQAPAVDGKIVTGWNGLAIGALARAGLRWSEPSWIDAAQWAADAIFGTNVRPDGTLIRASLNEIPSTAGATLADYGQLAAGLAALAAATGEVDYAVRARGLVAACVAGDLETSQIATPGGGDRVLASQGLHAVDAASDGDEPSGFASLADAALSLWRLGAGEQFRALAERIVAEHAASALSGPLAYGAVLRAACALVAPPRQLVVVTGEGMDLMMDAARGQPADVLAVVTPAGASAWAVAGFTLFEFKTAIDARATAYDCRDFACRLPTTDPSVLTR